MTTTGKVRRSISCYSLPVSGVADFPDDNEDHRVEERREMYEILKARKETLNARLAEKLAELKGICLQEAAITGILPRETPLHPNEPKPVIRRKVRTEFSLSDKLLTEPATEEEKRLSDLELQFEIQSKIVEASKKLMNELNIKQKVKKQRRANYDAAVDKLQHLESDLMRLKKQLQEEQRTQLEAKNRIKKKMIEQHMSPPAPSSQRIVTNGFMHNNQMTMAAETQQTAGNSRLSRKRRGKIGSSSSENDCRPVSCSPVVTREFKINPLSPVAGDDSPIPQTLAFSAAPLTPTSILKKSRPAVDALLNDEPDSVPCNLNSISLHSDGLNRSNSLENVRRKSYISAVSAPQTAPAYRGINYYNHHPLGSKLLPKNPPPPIPNSMAKRPLPPTPAQVDAMRLHGIASLSEPSVPEAIAVESQAIAAIQNPLTFDRSTRRVRNDSRQSLRKEDIDISLKAVRSSVIRTPAITVSTTSSSDAQLGPNNPNSSMNPNASSSSSRPTPTPSPSPLSTPNPLRSRAYSGPAAPEETIEPLDPMMCPSPTPSSASAMIYRLREQEQQQNNEESQAMPPPTNLPPRKPKKSLGKHIPAPLSLQYAPTSRSYTPEIRSFTTSVENDVFEQELVPPASPFISLTRTYVETPRPDTIAMSPQVNSQTGVVVEVGTCRPSYEETKPFEFSDALKYSVKHRRRQESELGSSNCNHQMASQPPRSESVTSEQSSSKGAVPNLMNESFIVSAAVSDDFHNEMVDWYDENLKKATVV